MLKRHQEKRVSQGWCWHRTPDGTYIRTCDLIMSEIVTVQAWPWWRPHRELLIALIREWERVHDGGPLRKFGLARGDIVVPIPAEKTLRGPQ